MTLIRRHPRPGRTLALLAALLVTCGVGAVEATARDGDDDEVRVSGSCGRGATAKLRLREGDDAIRVRFEVANRRPGESWRVVLVQDRRVVWRGRARTRATGSLEVERRVPELDGANHVRVRAYGPRGLTCYAAATLPG